MSNLLTMPIFIYKKYAFDSLWHYHVINLFMTWCYTPWIKYLWFLTAAMTTIHIATKMVATAMEILFSRIFPEQNYHFPGKWYTRFKGNKSKYVWKAYHIYSMYDWLLTILWYSVLLNPSSCLIYEHLFKF